MAAASLIKTPAGRAATDPDHDRHRRRKTERARARDDEHRDRVDDRVGKARLGPDPGPDRERDDRRREHRGNEIAGHFVGHALDRRPAALRLGDHLHDLRE